MDQRQAWRAAQDRQLSTRMYPPSWYSYEWVWTYLCIERTLIKRSSDLATLWRLTRKPIVLSNGIFIPSGTFVSAATAAYHKDEHLYQDPETFDPWRFVNSSKTLVTTNVDFIAFGHGRYAW